jgi:hypothetical protein
MTYKTKNIIKLSIILCYLLNSTCICYWQPAFDNPLPTSALRPIASASSSRGIILDDNVHAEDEKNRQFIADLAGRLEKGIPSDENSRILLGNEIYFVVTVLGSIAECFNSRYSNYAGSMAIQAIKNKMPGITASDVNSWIEACLDQGAPNTAGYIAIEAIRNGISGISAGTVKKSIAGCFDKGWPDKAGYMAIEAIRDNISGITADDVKRSIDECFKRPWPETAGSIAIEAIRNNIAGITTQDIKGWLATCINNGRLNTAVSIMVEAVYNNVYSVESDLLKKYIFKYSANNKADAKDSAIVKAIRYNVADITLDDIKTYTKQYLHSGQADHAGSMIEEAIRNNMPGITSDDIRDWISAFTSRGKLGLAGSIAAEVIRKNIPDIEEDIKNWIISCFYNGRPDIAGSIIIQALLKNIPGITIYTLNRSISLCFTQGLSDRAGSLAISAIDNNTPGITADTVKAWIQKFAEYGWPSHIGPILTAAVQNNVPGITADDIKGWVFMRSERNLPHIASSIAIEAIRNNTPGITADIVRGWIANIDIAHAGYIAVEAIKRNKFSRKTNRTLGLFRDIPRFQDTETLLFLYSGISHALINNQVQDLGLVLESFYRETQLVPMLKSLMDIEAEQEIWAEIFHNKGLNSFKNLYNKIYSHILSEALPDSLDIAQGRANMLLRAITRFDNSIFSVENTEKFEDIYNRYAEGLLSGNIKPLPDTTPGPAIIEVPTKASRSLSEPAQIYYSDIKKSLQSAISATEKKNENINPYDDITAGFIRLIDNERSTLSGMSFKNKDALAKIDKKTMLLERAKNQIVLFKNSNILPLLFIDTEALDALSRIKGARQLFREGLFIHSFINNPAWRNSFNIEEDNELTTESAAMFVEFVDSFLKTHILGGIEDDIKRILIRHVDPETFKQELGRLTGSRTALMKRIGIYPTRGWIAEYIGYFSDECWTRTPDIMKNNPDTIALIFIDEDNKELLGGTLLMPNYVQGKKVFIDRGLSPRTRITNKLDIGNFMEQVLDYQQKIAVRLGASGILAPLRRLQEGVGTNNPDIIQYYERVFADKPPVDLETTNAFNDHDITRGCCVFVREFSTQDAASIFISSNRHNVFTTLNSAA